MKKSKNIILWIIQVLLALLFIFTGVIKLITPIADLTKEIPLSGSLIRFIAIAEVLGAIGLVGPGIIKKWLSLTPLAAAGLLIIMIGAVIITFNTMGLVPAIMPLVVGLLCLYVAISR